MALFGFKPFGVRGLSLCSIRMVRIAVSRSAKLSGTKQPYEVEP